MVSAIVARQEIEIKLDLGSFTNYLKFLGFLGQIELEDVHLNGFYDTRKRDLSTQGWALRVRAESAIGRVTAKGMGKHDGMAVMRDEVEEELPRGEVLEVINGHRNPAGLDCEPLRFLTAKFGSLELHPLVKFKTTRLQKSHRIGDYSYTLEVDKTEFTDGSVDYELEVEMEDTAQLDVVENHLVRLFGSLDIPLERQTESKLARALKHKGLE